MTTINKLLKWTSFIPYAFSVVFFFLLTFPGMKNLNFHMEAGYLAYVLIGSFIVLLIHIGLVYLLFKYINKKHLEIKPSFTSLLERFNIVLGVLIVILFEGLCSNCFSYRQWAYGVNRAEAVFEKINNDWNSKQLETSKDVSKKMDKTIIEYTDSVSSKWQNLKSK